MSKLCESNAVEVTITLMDNEGWKSLSDATLTVCLIFLPWSRCYLLDLLLLEPEDSIKHGLTGHPGAAKKSCICLSKGCGVSFWVKLLWIAQADDNLLQLRSPWLWQGTLLLLFALVCEFLWSCTCLNSQIACQVPCRNVNIMCQCHIFIYNKKTEYSCMYF